MQIAANGIWQSGGFGKKKKKRERGKKCVKCKLDKMSSCQSGAVHVAAKISWRISFAYHMTAAETEPSRAEAKHFEAAAKWKL